MRGFINTDGPVAVSFARLSLFLIVHVNVSHERITALGLLAGAALAAVCLWSNPTWVRADDIGSAPGPQVVPGLSDPAGPAGARAGSALPWRDSAAAVPQRIVSMTPSVTETLFALGAGPRVVAVSSYCTYPPEVSSLPRVGTFLAPVIESVIYLQPDLVITSPSPGNKNAVAAIEGAGIELAVVSEGSGSVDDARSSIRQTARLVGLGLEGAALVFSIDTELERVRSASSGRPRPLVAVVVGHEPLVLAGPQSFLGELVEIGGGRNIAESLGGKWPRTSWEFLLAAEPAVVIDVSTGMDDGNENESLARRWSGYDSLPAVRDNRVHGHAGYLLARPGPRIGEAAQLVAGWIHPDPWRARR